MPQPTPLRRTPPAILRSGLAPDLNDRPIQDWRVTPLPGGTLVDLTEGSGELHIAAEAEHRIWLTHDGTRHSEIHVDRRVVRGPVPAGSVAVLPAGMPAYQVWQNHGAQQRVTGLSFGPDLFRTYLPEIDLPPAQIGSVPHTGFADRPPLAALIGIVGRGGDGVVKGRLYTDTAMRLLALELLSSLWSWRPEIQPVRLRGPDRALSRAVAFIEAHLDTDLSVLAIAEAAGLTPSQLGAAFRREFGRSTYAFVIDRRLDRATRLLRETDLPIALVALETGFADQAHLTRFCRARLDRTPRQIRRDV